MHRVFISDLHLDEPTSSAFQRFGELLDAESARQDEIFLLGDVVEMWIGDDDDSPCAHSLRALLVAATARCRVMLMHGNRDFLFGARFASATGVELIDDPYVTEDGLMLSHGDALCVDDIEYQAMRATLRGEPWQREILEKSLDERKAFGQALRAQSRASNANKPGNIMDVNRSATDAQMAASSAHALIHGHTHRPGVHHEKSYTRIVTGAWERCGWLCRQRDTDLQLECFSLARRYEI